MNKFRIFVDFVGEPESLQLLREEARGHELIFAKNPGGSVLSEAGTDPQLLEADIAFGQPDIAGISNAKNLKWVHVSSSGITRYDNPAFRTLVASRGIAVTNSASVFQEPCALHVLSFMMAQARCLPSALKSRAASGDDEWKTLRYSATTFRGKTALIFGCGAIGRRVAELVKPLGVNVIGYRRNPRGDETIPMITEKQLVDALATIDHVINILPDSPETRQCFDSRRFEHFKRGAIFYNIGRGQTVDQNALLEALRSGRIAAAWLDVTEPEPLPDDHPLWNEPNCFITPHIAGGHFEESKMLVRHFLNNLRRFEKGEKFADRVM